MNPLRDANAIILPGCGKAIGGPKGAVGANQAAPRPRNVGPHGQQIDDRPILRAALNFEKARAVEKKQLVGSDKNAALSI